jgi:uncharacterized protein (TIGR03437 family)
VNNPRIAVLLSFAGLLGAPAFAQTITGGSCSAANLTGTYSLSLSGRGISAAGSFSGSLQGAGTITFDGVSNVTMTGTVNTNVAAGKTFTYSGTYTIPSNCFGTITLTTGSTATFALVVWSNGSQYDMTGSDATYVYSGSGSNVRPPGCATATLSGPYTYDTSGFLETGTAQTGSADESGVLQFDGQGNVTASYAITSSGTTAQTVTATGTYSVASSCLVSATLTDSTGKTDALNFVIEGAYGQNSILLEANSGFVRLGTAHSAFLNPAESIANVASYAVNATPAGSVFALFGTGLATANKTAQATSTPLQTELLTTSVKVNGEPAPLYYVDSGDIDAQMPWDIPGGTVASVVVTFGTATSNAVAVFVPATGTPGISFYANNRAVVVNANGSTNSSTAAAAVGDEVVAYFTGGGPVTASGKLTTGAVSPPGQSPVTGSVSVTVGGIASPDVEYVGLTPGSVGLYQANFTVPQIAKGTYPLVITIGGQASNTLGGVYPNPVMTVSN